MKIRSVVAAAEIAFGILLAQAATAVAAEIKLVTTGGLRPAMNEIVPQFERTTGHKVTIQYGFTLPLSGETFDLIIATPDLISDLTKLGKIASGTRTMTARTRIGQKYIVLEAGIGATTDKAEAAQALINFLRTEDAASVMKAKGWEPLAQ